MRLLLTAVVAAAGAYTSPQADIHVRKGKVHDASINCRLSHGVTVESMFFFTPIRISASGRFSFHGNANYVHQTSSGYKSKPVTATLSGRLRSKRVTGHVTGGPGACSSVRFTATYNPSAHR